MEQPRSVALQPSGNSPQVFERISSAYPSLNDAERKVADFIHENAEVAKGLPVTRVGELSGVSQGTIVRFCRVIGFGGYSDFKLALAEDLAVRRSAVPYEHTDVEEGDSLGTIVRKVLSVDIRGINDLLHTLDMQEFEHAVQALSAASIVEVLGVGTSLPVAMDFHYRLLRSGVHSRNSVDSHMQAINAGLLGDKDAAVAISYSGEARETLDSVELAREAGATVICVTGCPSSSVARLSHICLVTPSVKMCRPLDDEAVTVRLVQLALFDALCVAVGIQKESEAVPMLEQIDKAVARKRQHY